MNKKKSEKKHFKVAEESLSSNSDYTDYKYEELNNMLEDIKKKYNLLYHEKKGIRRREGCDTLKRNDDDDDENFKTNELYDDSNKNDIGNIIEKSNNSYVSSKESLSISNNNSMISSQSRNLTSNFDEPIDDISLSEVSCLSNDEKEDIINIGNIRYKKNVIYPIDEKKISKDINNIYYNCISIFSLNTYLYNDIFRYNPHLFGFYENCRNNENRCKNIGTLCTQYNLIFLRSVYGKYQKYLFDKLKYTHTIMLDNIPWCNNLLNEIYYTAQNYLYGNGGLYICWTKMLFHLSYYDFMFLSSDIIFKRKVIKLIKLIYDNKYHLYFFSLEFDLYSTQNKISNIKDLVFFMKKIFWKIYIFFLFYKNRKFLKRRKENTKGYIKYKGGNIKSEKELNDKNNYNINDNNKYNSNNNNNNNNNLYDNNILNEEKQKYISTMIFKNSSIFIIGTFNIDIYENKELYENLITLNNHAVMKDMFFYKNIHYKLQRTYNIVDRKNNTLVNGLNYCFGLTDNIFLVKSFFLDEKDIYELMSLYNPIDIIVEKFNNFKKNKSINNYMIHNIFKLINKNGIYLKFQEVYNYGVDILTQKKGKEFSDHWILSAKFDIKNKNKNINLNIENKLCNFLYNVNKYFILNKKSYHKYCQVKYVTKRKREKNNRKKVIMNNTDHIPIKMEKYDYSRKICIISDENINTINQVDTNLYHILLKCFEEECNT
ncbi:conserved Plasmodium protein, unknown function [Plasmodium gaboni]|uniref:DNase I-like protein n=1 Tax=Plasmodium gaboni TaxID=647221 RepID=A0ABY1USU5_9APIC|nr:conserved Plasmodium protein, unknown function [Plasmodium gaboni]